MNPKFYKVEESVAQELFNKGLIGDLVVYMQPIVIAYAMKTFRNIGYTTDEEDLIQDINLRLLKHLHNYNPEKSRITTYVTRSCINAIWDMTTDKKKEWSYTVQLGDFDDDEYDNKELHDMEVNLELQDILLNHADKLTKSEAKVARKIYKLVSQKAFEFRYFATIAQKAEVNKNTMTRLMAKLKELK